MVKAQKKKASRPASTNLDSRLRAAKLSDGQIKLLKSHGYSALSENKIKAMKRAHARYLAGARFRPNIVPGTPPISLEDAERRVERYLESMEL